MFIEGVPIPDWGTLGIGGAMASLVFFFYRQDRKASEDRYAADRKTSEERYAALAIDFRQIVQENTQAVTGLKDMIGRQK